MREAVPARSPRVVFLNQVTGPLFRQLAEDVADALGPSVLVTGWDPLYREPRSANLSAVAAPAYDRSSLVRRLSTWTAYFAVALWRIFRTDRRTLVFLVSNPPFLALAGWLASLLRGQKYVVLVYDLYPGLLEAMGRLRPRSVVSRAWRAMNRLTWGRAEVVFTIGDYMAANVNAGLDGLSRPPRVVVIPNWADGSTIRPLGKDTNPFAAAHGQVDKLTVMYSGNVGGTHNLDGLLQAAAELQGDPGLHFLIIGGGARWAGLESQVRLKGLANVTLLPFQPEELLPLTLATADVAVVTLEAGVEGFSVPSKTYYALAAGAALLVMSRGPNELTDLVRDEACGLSADPASPAEIAAAIRRFRADPGFVRRCRENARAAQERRYSRANTSQYVDALRPLLPAAGRDRR